jgi:hypothetical protein
MQRTKTAGFHRAGVLRNHSSPQPGVYEYGYFGFTGVGTVGVSTNEVFI